MLRSLRLLLAVSFFLPLGTSFAKAPLAPATPAPAATPAFGPGRWEKEVRSYERQDKVLPPQPGGIVFTGSSSIRLWGSLGSDFPGLHVLNRGIGGSEIADHLVHVERLVFPYAPRQVVFYCGGNDLNRKQPVEVVAENFRKYAALIHAKLPQTRISYISSAPNPARWKQVENVKKLNAAIQAFCAEHPDYLEYIDVFSKMLGADGQPLPDIYRPDRLHMVAKGYAIWTNTIAPHLLPESAPVKK